MLGVPRADAHVIYGKRADGTNIPGTGGLGQIYGLSVARLLADNDEPDQLVLSLYGQLAIGMTPRHVRVGRGRQRRPAGGRVLPEDVHAAQHRGQQHVPRDASAHARARAARERRGSRVVSTSRSRRRERWLGDGKTIEVNGARTSFGRLSYTITRAGRPCRVGSSHPRRYRRSDSGCGCLPGSVLRACGSAGARCGSTGVQARSTSPAGRARSSSSPACVERRSPNALRGRCAGRGFLTRRSTTARSCSASRRPARRGVVGLRERELGVDDAGAHQAEDLLVSACAQMPPNEPGLAPITATGLPRKAAVVARPRAPVERVLQRSRDGAVVLGRHDQDRIRVCDR